MKNATKTDSGTVFQLKPIDQGEITVFLLGDSPFVCNRMSQKVKRELLLPPVKKNRTEKENSLKHDPIAEFRASPYMLVDKKAPTLLAAPAVAFKRALASAAIDLGGIKAQVGRVCWAIEELTPLYGIPELWMAVTRNRDMARTPDIRTRAILPQWCASVTFSFMRSIIRENQLLQLLTGGGLFIGVGDGRPEKGALAYGRFSIVQENDPRVKHLVKFGGRAAQQAAMDNPKCYDLETADMLEWYTGEVRRRELDRVQRPKVKGRPPTTGNGADHTAPTA